MSTIVVTDEINQNNQENPGSQLARIREKKGLSQEYIAGKLHLRTRVIELLEADDYQQMPEPVFIKGYLRGYAKVLGIAPEPFLAIFNNQHAHERKPEKTLWQSKRESNKGERVVRWITSMVAVAAVVAVSVWWQKNKDAQPFFATKDISSPNTNMSITANTILKAPATKKIEHDADARLNDLSRMQSMFSSSTEESVTEKRSG